jgi:flagellar motor switch protein FliG
MAATQKPMPIDRTIATVLLSIDQDLAAKVLRSFSDDTLDKVTRAMQELQEMAVDRDALRSCYLTAVQRMRQGGMALGDVGGMM